MPPETLADLLTSLQQGCPGPVLGLSCGAQHTLTVLSKLFLAVGGLAAVSVPFVLYRIQRRQAMARATIELGKSIWVDPHLLQKMEKIHRYRRYEDGLSTHNPYNGDEDGLRWDHVIVLNFFEAYCAEISSGQVYVQQVFEYAAGTIVGVRNSILHRMVQRGVAKPTDYESLSAVADRIEKIAKESNRSVTWSIKNGDA